MLEKDDYSEDESEVDFVYQNNTNQNTNEIIIGNNTKEQMYKFSFIDFDLPKEETNEIKTETIKEENIEEEIYTNIKPENIINTNDKDNIITDVNENIINTNAKDNIITDANENIINTTSKNEKVNNKKSFKRDLELVSEALDEDYDHENVDNLYTDLIVKPTFEQRKAFTDVILSYDSNEMDLIFSKTNKDVNIYAETKEEALKKKELIEAKSRIIKVAGTIARYNASLYNLEEMGDRGFGNSSIFKNKDNVVKALKRYSLSRQFLSSLTTLVTNPLNSNLYISRDAQMAPLLLVENPNDLNELLKNYMEYCNVIYARDLKQERDIEKAFKYVDRMLDKYLAGPKIYDFESENGIYEFIKYTECRFMFEQMITFTKGNDGKTSYEKYLKQKDPIKYYKLMDKMGVDSQYQYSAPAEIMAATGLCSPIGAAGLKGLKDKVEGVAEREILPIAEAYNKIKLKNSTGAISARNRLAISSCISDTMYQSFGVSNFNMDYSLYGVCGDGSRKYSDLSKLSIEQLCEKYKFEESTKYSNASNAKVAMTQAKEILTYDFMIMQLSNPVYKNTIGEAKICDNLGAHLLYVNGKSIDTLANEYISEHGKKYSKDDVISAIFVNAINDPNKVMSLVSIVTTKNGFEPKVVTLNKNYSDLAKNVSHSFFEHVAHFFGGKYKEDVKVEKQIDAIRNFNNKVNNQMIKDSFLAEFGDDLLNANKVELGIDKNANRINNLENIIKNDLENSNIENNIDNSLSEDDFTINTNSKNIKSK